MAKKKNQRSAVRGDVEIGQRLRLRRTEQKMSQAELGDQLGVSFQQVQKYEKGTNRIGASRLQKIAEVLQVPVTFFYSDGISPRDGKGQLEMESLLFTDSRFALRLLRAYVAIKDVPLQRQMVSLMEKLAGVSVVE